MRIAFIADGRSEHVRRWLPYFVELGDEVLLLSTYPCTQNLPGITVQVLPKLFYVGQSMVKRETSQPKSQKRSAQSILLSRKLYSKVWPLWHHATVVEVPLQALITRRFLNIFKPDVVHAIRIQNEGYVGALAGYHPLILSSWGSDFIFIAQRYRLHSLLTRETLRKPNAFTADCHRDFRFARSYGFADNKPMRYFPGNGGINLKLFSPGQFEAQHREPIVIYSRGVSPFYRVDTLLSAIELVLANRAQKGKFVLLVPQATIPTLEKMRNHLNLPESRVIIRPFVRKNELVKLLQKAAVSVSPSISDGTPNSMLEAMACGAFPVMSNLESIREWITHGGNGLLFDPTNANDLASCIREALNNPVMRQVGQKINLAIVKKRADYTKIMPEVRQFYQNIANNWQR
jgi:glycosyltransferase involved in cell wall biosynthesis